MSVRFRTRTLMAAVALVALAIVLPGESRLRRERRHLARQLAHHLEVAALHDRERAVCESAAGRVPYDPLARQWAWIGPQDRPPEFRDWVDEAAWRAGKAEAYRAEAASVRRDERAVRRRLHFPVIWDTERPDP